MYDSKKILIIGGTGHYGQHIVRALLTKNIAVRILSRNKTAALARFENHGNRELLEVYEGDILNPPQVRNSLQDISAIVIALSAFNRNSIRQMWQIEHDAVLELFRLAQEANIDRLVYISVYEKPAAGIKMQSGRIKRCIETALEQSLFDYTILGAPPSIEIFFSLIRGGTMRVPGGGPAALPNISPIDLGEIAAQTVLRTNLPQKRYRLTGPSAPSFPEAAIRISKESGQNIPYMRIPLFPLRIAAIITSFLRVFMPYIAQLIPFIILMNNFEDIIKLQTVEDYKILRETFNYTPHTLEDHTRLWMKEISTSN